MFNSCLYIIFNFKRGFIKIIAMVAIFKFGLKRHETLWCSHWRKQVPVCEASGRCLLQMTDWQIELQSGLPKMWQGPRRTTYHTSPYRMHQQGLALPQVGHVKQKDICCHVVHWKRSTILEAHVIRHFEHMIGIDIHKLCPCVVVGKANYTVPDLSKK